jgi:hypothetical protein
MNWLDNIDWPSLVQSLVTIAVAAIPGWLAYLAKVRETRVSERKIESDAESVLTKDLLATLKYKDDRIRDLQAQAIVAKERCDMQIASVQTQCQALLDENETITETLHRAMARIDNLEWTEKGYLKLVEYTKALEQEIVRLGIDWNTIDVTRVITLHDWEGRPHVDIVGDLMRKEDKGED